MSYFSSHVTNGQRPGIRSIKLKSIQIETTNRFGEKITITITNTSAKFTITIKKNYSGNLGKRTRLVSCDGQVLCCRPINVAFGADTLLFCQYLLPEHPRVLLQLRHDFAARFAFLFLWRFLSKDRPQFIALALKILVLFRSNFRILEFFSFFFVRIQNFENFFVVFRSNFRIFFRPNVRILEFFLFFFRPNFGIFFRFVSNFFP